MEVSTLLTLVVLPWRYIGRTPLEGLQLLSRTNILIRDDILPITFSCESRRQWDWCQCLFCSFEVHRAHLQLQIMLAFYIQGLLNLGLFNYSWVLKHFTSKRIPSKRTKLKEWIDSLLAESVFGTTAAAYALCIAAFTQWKTITAYHLFLCDTLLSSLAPVTIHSHGLTLFRPQKLLDRILIVYFLGNKILMISIKCVNIYRFSIVWADMAGKCFIASVDGDGSPSERDDVVLWLYMGLVLDLLGELVPALVDWSGRSELWAPQNPKARLLLIILFSRIPSTFFFIWGLHWTIKLMIANRKLIDGNEFEFGFEQIVALVTIVLSISRAIISYVGA